VVHVLIWNLCSILIYYNLYTKDVPEHDDDIRVPYVPRNIGEELRRVIIVKTPASNNRKVPSMRDTFIDLESMIIFITL